MNVKNNKRRKESRAKIEVVFLDLIQDKELNQISVSEICKKSGLNRTTFYANYVDIYDLADNIRKTLEENYFYNYFEPNQVISSLTKLFYHIKENQLFYKTYFKLGYDSNYKIIGYSKELAFKHFNNKFIEYHCEFFRSGITAIIKMWLNNGCKETPEEICEIIETEYSKRTL